MVEGRKDRVLRHLFEVGRVGKWQLAHILGLVSNQHKELNRNVKNFHSYFMVFEINDSRVKDRAWSARAENGQFDYYASKKTKGQK